jgi:glycosyltransferase involved in cell wall biosynthesis
MKHTVLKLKILVSANTSWYLYNFRLPLLRELVSRGHHVYALAPPDSYAKKLAEIGIEHIPINITRSGLNPFADMALFSQFLSIYRRHKPDIVQHFTVKPVIYGTLAAHVCGVPHIFNMVPGMGYVFTGTSIKKFWVQRVVRLLYKATMNFSDHVFFQNQDDRNYFLGCNLVNAARTSIVSGTGVDTTKFRPGKKKKKRTVTFVMAARMLWDKGVGEYVKAARLVKRKYPNSRFWILGPVDMENPKGIKIEQLRSWNSEGAVQYLGMTDSVKKYLSEADVIVLPSYYREGIPLSLLEGAAMAMPIITTDSPGCREVVMKGQEQNGFLIPIKDPQALAAAMEQLIEKPALIWRMGKESRNLVKRKFDSKIVVKKILHYYPI